MKFYKVTVYEDIGRDTEVHCFLTRQAAEWKKDELRKKLPTNFTPVISEHEEDD